MLDLTLDLDKYIYDNSDVVHDSKIYNSDNISFAQGPLVATSGYVTRIKMTENRFSKNLYSMYDLIVDLNNGNVLKSFVRNGYSRVTTNILWMYRKLGFDVTANDLKKAYENWSVTGDSIDFFVFFEKNYMKKPLNGSIIKSVIGYNSYSRVDKTGETIELSILSPVICVCFKPKNCTPYSGLLAKDVAFRIYNLMRMIRKDNLLVFLQNTPSNLNKVLDATGLGKIKNSNSKLIEEGLKQIIYNIPLSDLVKTDDDIERLSELFQDLSEISNRFKEAPDENCNITKQ